MFGLKPAWRREMDSLRSAHDKYRVDYWALIAKVNALYTHLGLQYDIDPQQKVVSPVKKAPRRRKA